MANHLARLATAAKVTALTADDSDTVDLPRTAQALFITVAGNVRFMDGAGVDQGLMALPIGLFPVQIKRIYATGLSATGLVLYDKDPS